MFGDNKSHFFTLLFLSLGAMHATIIEDDKRQVSQEALIEQQLNKFFIASINQALVDDNDITIRNTIAQALNEGADVNRRSRDGDTPLLLAVANNALNLLRLLVKWPPTNLTVRTNDNKTALLLAVEVGSPEMVRILLQKQTIQALINEQDNEKNTALIRAAKNSNLPIIQQLLQIKHIDLNIQDDAGNTALYYAAIANKPEIIQALLAHPGINPFLYNDLGSTALDQAAFNGNLEAVEALLAIPYPAEILQQAIQKAQFRFVKGMTEVDRKDITAMIELLQKAYQMSIKEQKSHAAGQQSKRRKIKH